MAVITLPTSGIRSVKWTNPQPVVQRVLNGWTQSETIVSTGRFGPWTADIEVAPRTAADVFAWQTFFSELQGPLNSFRLEAVEADQHVYTETILIDGAGQTGSTLNVKGGPLGAGFLFKGSLITVALSGGREQMIPLAANLAFDGSGNGVATLAVPLISSPGNESSVAAKRPYAQLRLTSPVGWSVSPGPVYEPFSFSAREAW